MEKPKRLGDDQTTDAFSVNKEEKRFTLMPAKKWFGASTWLSVTKKQYSRCILRLEYKWLENRFSPRTDWDRDAGVLFYVHGNLKKLWPNSIEMQVGETRHRYGQIKRTLEGAKTAPLSYG